MPIADKTITINGKNIVVSAAITGTMPLTCKLTATIGQTVYSKVLTIGDSDGNTTLSSLADLQAALDSSRNEVAVSAAKAEVLRLLAAQLT